MSVHSDKAKQSMEKCIEALKNNLVVFVLVAQIHMRLITSR